MQGHLEQMGDRGRFLRKGRVCTGRQLKTRDEGKRPGGTRGETTEKFDARRALARRQVRQQAMGSDCMTCEVMRARRWRDACGHLHVRGTSGVCLCDSSLRATQLEGNGLDLWAGPRMVDTRLQLGAWRRYGLFVRFVRVRVRVGVRAACMACMACLWERAEAGATRCTLTQGTTADGGGRV